MSIGVTLPNCDVAIMARIVHPERGDLSLAAARAFLKFDFEKSDHERMRVLSQKANAAALTPAEEAELDDYQRVGHLLGLLQSKARLTLKKGANGRR